jgi:hypothetical protein
MLWKFYCMLRCAVHNLTVRCAEFVYLLCRIWLDYVHNLTVCCIEFSVYRFVCVLCTIELCAVKKCFGRIWIFTVQNLTWWCAQFLSVCCTDWISLYVVQIWSMCCTDFDCVLHNFVLCAVKDLPKSHEEINCAEFDCALCRICLCSVQNLTVCCAEFNWCAEFYCWV